MLPGQIEKLRHSVDEGCGHEGCTNNPTHKLCTESDSFGDEIEYYCDEHIEVVRKEMAEAPEVEENCEWCGKLAVLRPHRDWEEGTGGPCYDLCSECIGRNVQDGIDDYAMTLEREDAEEDDHYEEDEELDPVDESRDQWYMGNWVPAKDFNIGLDHVFKFSISGPRLVKQESAFGDHIVFTAHFRTGNVRMELQLKYDSLIIYGERRIVSFEKAMAVANKIRTMGYPVKRAGSEEEVEPQPVVRQKPHRSAGESELGLRPQIIDASFLMAVEDEQELLKNVVVDTFKPGVSDLNGNYFKPPQTPEEGHDLSGDVNEFSQNHPDFD